MKIIAFLPLLALYAGAANAAPLSLRQAITEAVASAPQIQAQDQEAQAARSAARAAGALPDPRLTMSVDNFPISGPAAGSFTRDEMTMLTLGVMQDVPSGASRRAQRAIGRADVEVALSQGAVQRRQVALEVSLAWVNLYYAARRLAALDQLDRENSLAAELAPTRVAMGDATPAEGPEPARLRALLENRRAEVRVQLAAARAALVRWIGDDALVAEAVAPPAWTVNAALLRARLEQHPAVLAFEANGARADAEVDRARAGRRPDFTLEADYHHRDGRFGDMISGRVTIDLPLFQSSRQEPLIAASAARAGAVRLQREAARRQLAAELDSEIANFEGAQERLQRTRSSIIPLARQRVDLATASFRGLTQPFAPVLEARRELAEAEISAVDLEAEVARSAVRLLVYYGGDFQ